MKAVGWIVFALVVAAGAAVGGLYGIGVFGDDAPETRAPGEATGAGAAAACREHGIARCPFCEPSLLESMGFCGGHGVPEAICTRCCDDLEPVFRALNDWCAGHGLPESQCEACNPGALDKYRKYGEGGAGGGSGEEGERAEGGRSGEQGELGEHRGGGEQREREQGEDGEGGENAKNAENGTNGTNAKTGKTGKGDPHAAPRPSLAGGQGQTQGQTQGHSPSELPIEVEVVAGEVPRVRRLPSLTCATERSVIRFADAGVAARAGLETAEVVRAPLRRTLAAPAEVRYGATGHAVLASRAAGYVAEVCVQLGDRVEAGDALVAVDSAALGRAESELLQAAARVSLWQKNQAREERLLAEKLSTERSLLEAETRLAESRIAVAAARQVLRSLGLSSERIAAVEAGGDTSSRLEVTAPFAGVVVELPAVVGQLADPSTPLVAVADTSRVWVLADVPQREIGAVAAGQPLLLTWDGAPGETFAGRVTWISTRVDPRTRTIKVRADLDNPGGRLRAGVFGRARIVTRDGEPAVLVAKAAVQWEGCCNVAFVQRSASEFVPRKLHLGYDTGEHYEVLAGLQAGERVVTRGSFLLKTELQKGSIGAGCCEVDHLDK